MKDLLTLTPRHLLFTWLAGLAFAFALLNGAWRMQRALVRSTMPQFARREILAANRAREVDSLFAQYAKEHPDDRSAQLQAGQAHARRLREDKTDSINRIAINRMQVDTSFNYRAESERSWILKLSGSYLTLALLAVGVLTPFALVMLTIVWAAYRSHERATRSPT